MTTPSTGFVIANGSAIVGDLSLNFAALKYNNTFTQSNAFNAGITCNAIDYSAHLEIGTATQTQLDLGRVSANTNIYASTFQLINNSIGKTVFSADLSSSTPSCSFNYNTFCKGLFLNNGGAMYCSTFYPEQNNTSTMNIGTAGFSSTNTSSNALNIGNSNTAININGSSVTAPTPLTSDNSTKVATTAFVQDLVQKNSFSY